jgi:hypothetical protein
MAQTQIRTRIAQIQVQEETAQDTYLAPTGGGANMFLAENVSASWESENWVPNYVRADGLNMDEVPGTISGTISFEIVLKGSGSAGTAPDWIEAIKACGVEDTTDATGGTVTLSPLMTFDGAGGNPGPSYSVSFLENGTRYALGAAFGNFTLTAEVGVPARLAFTFQGQYQAYADDALEVPTYNTTAAPAFLGASFATNFGGSYTPKGLTTFSFDKGNVIALGRDANESTGIYGARINSYNSGGSFECEQGLQATNDYFGDWRAGTTGTVASGTIGGTAGNQWAFATTRSVLRNVELAEADGIRRLTVGFSAGSATTDVEGTNHPWTLTLT